MSFDRSTFMKNWWKARQCHGCKFLHLGRQVDHNHCDAKSFGEEQENRERRVNGRREFVCADFWVLGQEPDLFPPWVYHNPMVD